MSRSFAIIGTGAIGGYCAVKLQQADFSVHCLARSDYSHIKEQGLNLIHNDKKTHVAVNVYHKAEDMPTCDVILVTLKTTANDILKNVLPKIMHSSSIVVLLQNGIGMEQELSAYIPAEKIIGAVCSLKVTKISPGTIHHHDFNSFTCAQYYSNSTETGVTKAVEELTENFATLGFKSKASPQLASIRWHKLIDNIPMNGSSVVLNAGYSSMLQNSATYQLLCRLTQEIIATAKKCHALLPENSYESRLNSLEILKNLPAAVHPSMKDDFDAKRPLELHAIYENAIKTAREHGADMPLTEMLYQQLIYLNEVNLAEK